MYAPYKFTRVRVTSPPSGIGGLATAFALARTGHRVRVFDKLDGRRQVNTAHLQPMSNQTYRFFRSSVQLVCEYHRICPKSSMNGGCAMHFRKLPNVARQVF